MVEFARISDSLKSGDDIANIEALSGQALSDRDYVKVHLNGTDPVYGDPNSCEAQLYQYHQKDYLGYSTYVRREPYPFPIDHTIVDWGIGTGGSNDKVYDVPINDPAQPTDGVNSGFLYGDFYYNDWAGPTYSTSGGTRCGEQLRTLQDFGSADVHLSLPGPNPNYDPSHPTGGGAPTSDIGGLSPTDGTYPNTCGVVLNFEKKFNVY